MWWKIIVPCALNKTERATTLLTKCTDGLLILLVLMFASIWTHFSSDAQREMSSVAANCLTTDDEIKANCAKSKPSFIFTVCQKYIEKNLLSTTNIANLLWLKSDHYCLDLSWTSLPRGDVVTWLIWLWLNTRDERPALYEKQAKIILLVPFLGYPISYWQPYRLTISSFNGCVWQTYIINCIVQVIYNYQTTMQLLWWGAFYSTTVVFALALNSYVSCLWQCFLWNVVDERVPL